MATFTGTANDDTLIGGAGADIFNGLAGIDTYFGGGGNDTFNIDNAAELIFEDIGGGTDIAISTVSFYLPANVEVLTLASGSGAIFGVGNELENTINGNEFANLIIGGGGTDVLSGGAGNDQIFGEAGDDIINGGNGIDYIVGGDGNDIIAGAAGADEIYGGAGNDQLVGGDGDFVTDILVGGDGNDFLDGASGLGDFDFLYGEGGNDNYTVDTPADLVFEFANGGTDTVFANIVGAGYYLYDEIENLVLEGNTPFGVGNASANVLTGNGIGNFLLGGLGADRLNGKAGNDVLFGESGADTFIFQRGTGGDVIGDFTPGSDKILLSGVGITSFTQVQTLLVEVAGTTALDLGNGDFIVINGIANAQLTAIDFQFG